MSEFYGIINGVGETSSTRTGKKNTGLTTHCNTWTFGVKCRAVHDDETGKNKIFVYATSGSSQRGESRLLAVVNEDTLSKVERVVMR
jgi:hypothetical protein